MAIATITVTVTDSDGSSATGTTTVQTDTITITSITVTPQTAPVGTTRNLTVVATSSAGLALTYGTPVSAGITFTPVNGQPGQWTFVY